MPVLDACINSTFEPGNIGSAIGTPPVIIRKTTLYPPGELPDDVIYSYDFGKTYNSMYLNGGFI